MYKQNICPK